MMSLGILIAILGPIIAWIASWILYGFGQLIENSDTIAGKINIIAENNYIIAENSNAITENCNAIAENSSTIALNNQIAATFQN